MWTTVRKGSRPNYLVLPHMEVASYIGHLLRIPGLLLQVRRQLRVQRAFMQAYLSPILEPLKQHNDGSLCHKDFKKIEKYYSVAVPAVLGEAFAALRGKPLTHHERLAATYLATTTGLYDDYFEQQTLTDAYIENLYRHPEQYPGQNDNERLGSQCWVKALSMGPDRATTIGLAHRVQQAQIDSRLQVSPQIDAATIRDITFRKGGYSVLIYLSILHAPMHPANEAMLYKAGALLQLENDIFDVYKDSRDDIRTLATTAVDIAPLRQEYNLLWQQLIEAVHQTPYAAAGKRAFIHIISAIVSRGFVCLDMLALRQKEQGGSFNPWTLPRKALICDMEKPINLLRTIHYFASHTP